jgi:pantetheine-phosphate adenylyltransferase
MAHEPRVAIVPGSFDPVTVGHVDLIERAARLFDRIIIAVLTNTTKQPFFALDDRVAMLCEVFTGRGSIEVDTFGGLLVDYARAKQARVVVRGLRGLSDFDTETQMALMNRRLNPDIETVFVTSSEGSAYVSSRLVREIASLGGSVDGLVPPVVADRIAARRRKSTLRQV